MAVRSAHDTVDLVHWMIALAEHPAFAELVESAGVSAARCREDCQRELAALRRGTGGTPGFSPSLVALAREAWVSASLAHGRRQVALVDLAMVLASDPSLRSLACAIAPALRGLNLAVLEAEASRLADASAHEAQPERPVPVAAGDDFLSLYTQDMTAAAAQGRIDPVIGREAELRQVIDILMRRRQNNPILVGEAGVGKTAVAEAFALQIAAGDVPDALKGIRLLSLDLSLLQAGAGVKGEFERRLRGVVDAVKASPQPVILFIDEAHGLIGAGNQPGQGDAANILKPSLARGELRTIAATTWSEYKRHIERDAALTRRFQTVNVAEPDEETAVRMLRGIAAGLQSHHGVRIRDEALRAAVRLSTRYIPARQLPDKAISLIDTAAASVAFCRQAEPAALADLRRERAMLALESERIAAEPQTEEIAARRDAIGTRCDELDSEIDALDQRLRAERELLAEADALEDRLALEDGGEPRTELAAAERRLAALQGEAALVHRVVDADAIAGLVARWTGVPVGRLVTDQIAAVNDLAARLKARVVGQDAAIEALSAAMRVSRARLSDPRRPPGVFLMIGMSGVGKTETALALADLLYGGPQNLTTINMSEFKEEHKVSMLVGSPPGYVGYGEGGVLTEAVRRRPYGVLLLDEMDKAHPGVQDVFYQVFDKGSLRDGEGRDIDFKNTTILMTANTGSEMLAALAADPETMPEGEALLAVLKTPLQAQFKPAFLGRTTILPYRPLDAAAIAGIVEIQIARVKERVAGSYGCEVAVTGAVRDRLAAGAAFGETGARAIETTVSRELLPALSTHFLDAIVAGSTKAAIEIDVANGVFVVRVTESARPSRKKGQARPMSDPSAGPKGSAKPSAKPSRAPSPVRVAV